MATEKWVNGAGQGLTWGTAMNTGDLFNLGISGSVLSSVADIANGTILDQFADFSFQMTPAITIVSPQSISVFIYPLNSDGSTYGDNKLSAGAGSLITPSPEYWVGNIMFPQGATTPIGTLTRIPIPPGSFRFVVQNLTGALLVTCTTKYRTYNRQIA